MTFSVVYLKLFRHLNFFLSEIQQAFLLSQSSRFRFLQISGHQKYLKVEEGGLPRKVNLHPPWYHTSQSPDPARLSRTDRVDTCAIQSLHSSAEATRNTRIRVAADGGGGSFWPNSSPRKKATFFHLAIILVPSKDKASGAGGVPCKVVSVPYSPIEQYIRDSWYLPTTNYYYYCFDSDNTI